MAINTSDYNPTKEKNIKVHKKDKRLFYFDFRINKKRYTKLFKITATNHSPSEMLKRARQELDFIKDEIKNGTFGNDRVKLDFLLVPQKVKTSVFKTDRFISHSRKSYNVK